MRKLIATVFNYSLNGLLPDEGTEELPVLHGPARRPGGRGAVTRLYPERRRAHHGPRCLRGHGRCPAEGSRPPRAHRLDPRARKVVFSRTLKTADWANTTIAAGDTAEEIDKLKRGGDGHIVVWGGRSFWRSLTRLDLIDEFHVDLFPYVAGEGTWLFDDVPKSYRLELVSSTAWSNGIVGLHYRRHR
jgi:RibD C-terminal domain